MSENLKAKTHTREHFDILNLGLGICFGIRNSDFWHPQVVEAMECLLLSN
jgi:hypothetical protein